MWAGGKRTTEMREVGEENRLEIPLQTACVFRKSSNPTIHKRYFTRYKDFPKPIIALKINTYFKDHLKRTTEIHMTNHNATHIV